jgi:hypothetical protein
MTLTISGSRRGEVTDGWRKSHNEKFHISYPSPSTIRITKLRMRMAGHVARIAYRISVVKDRRKEIIEKTKNWLDESYR